MFCPRDNTQLKVTARQGVEFDYCPQCRGVWLDRGEMEKLIEEGLKENDVYPAGAGFPPPGGPGAYPPPPAPGYYPPQGGYNPEHGGEYQGGGKHGGKHGGEHGGGYSTPYPGGGQQGRKRKSFLSDIFDF